MIKSGNFNRLTTILNENNQIIIPDLQRDYCWGEVIPEGQKHSLAYNFTNELIELSRKISTTQNAEISYGIIYSYEYPETFYYLCDGQQRLTTLYLIIGVLNTYSKKNSLVNLLRLENGQPRLRYEVRNSTDYFIKDLVESFIHPSEKLSFSELDKANWYRKEYEDDPSIKSMIAALKSIQSIIKKEDATQLANFLLSTIGFVYVNLEANEQLDNSSYSKIREYGEKMYEIVNTSGDPMQPNEHLKSELLSKVDDSEKAIWTEKWEIFQDFFWNYRDKSHETADEGFNEFIRWIKSIKDKDENIESVLEVEKYFKAIFLIFNLQDDLTKSREFKILDFKESLHSKKPSKLVVILPIMVYLKDSPLVFFGESGYKINKDAVELDKLFRFVRFFSNISKYSDAAGLATDLAITLKKDEDIVELLKFRKANNSILSDEEIYKLELYKKSDRSERILLEDKFWNAEDNDYLNGKIQPIFSWMEVEDSLSVSDNFDGNLFLKLYNIYRDLLSVERIKETNLYFLAVVTNWNFFIEGWSWGVPRFYLGLKSDVEFWRRKIITQEFGILVSKEYKGELNVKFMNESLMENVQNVDYRKAFRKLKQEAHEHWQWSNNVRFLVKDGSLHLPNGRHAKSNTKEIKL